MAVDRLHIPPGFPHGFWLDSRLVPMVVAAAKSDKMCHGLRKLQAMAQDSKGLDVCVWD